MVGRFCRVQSPEIFVALFRSAYGVQGNCIRPSIISFDQRFSGEAGDPSDCRAFHESGQSIFSRVRSSWGDRFRRRRPVRLRSGQAPTHGNGRETPSRSCRRLYVSALFHRKAKPDSRLRERENWGSGQQILTSVRGRTDAFSLMASWAA